MGATVTDPVDPPDASGGTARQTLRLTFQVIEGQVRLVNQERVDMICPPDPSEKPRAGEHSGFWTELRDARDKVLAHRVLSDPIVNSVEVFSPEGTIRREFGLMSDRVFEVLLPAEPQARSVAVVGEPASPGFADAVTEATPRARVLARFDLAPEIRGGRR